MAKSEYTVGPAIDEEKLQKYAELLNQAYERGDEADGEMDWDDIQKAHDMAVEALGDGAREFVADANSDEGHEDGVKLLFPETYTEISNEAWSACLLLLAYRYPEDVKWEDVDDAWESLHCEQAAAPGHP